MRNNFIQDVSLIFLNIIFMGFRIVFLVLLIFNFKDDWVQDLP